MNILAVCHYGLYQELSSSFVHNLIREYAALGHRVVCLVPVPLGKADRKGNKFSLYLPNFTHDGVEIRDFRYLSLSGRGRKGFNHKSAIAALQAGRKTLLGDFRPDAIHAHTLGFDSEIGAWLKDQFRCPLVVTTHGSDTARPMAHGESGWLKTCCDKADHLTAVSNPLRDLLKTCGTAVPVTTIHNGFVPRIPETEEKDPYSIIQVGHLIESKRFDTTIRALAALKDNYPQLHLTIVGEGPLRSSLEDLCRELDVADRVQFTGPVPNAEVFARMCRSQFFVMVSKPEGFGIVYLEAMAAGCLTIGTKDQGIADILIHGKNGYLAEAGDWETVAAILDHALQNPETTQTIAAAGQTLARTMTWENAAKNYLSLFETL